MPRKRWPPRMRTSFPFALKLRAKGPQRDFAVVPRSQRFFDARFAIRQKAGKQQASLYLGTGDRHPVIDPFKVTSR